MSIGDVFSRAFELWKRDVLWLILAALVVGLIVGVIAAIVGAIVFGVALSGVGLGLSTSSNTFSGVGAGMLVLALIAYIVGVFAIAVLGMTLYGGLFEMVIGAAREGRPVRFNDLFSGFRKFGSYAMFALVIAGIAIGLSLIAIFPIIGWIISAVLGIWIGVLWLYVLPLIADQGLTWGEARLRSQAMVKEVGWWKTFGTLILLLVAIWVVGLVIALLAAALGRASSSAGSVIGSLLFIAFEVVVGPYVICYVSTMYLGSGGVVEPAFAGAAVPPPPPPDYGLPPAPPAPPAPAAQSAAPQTPLAAAAAAPAEPAVDRSADAAKAETAAADETTLPEPPVAAPEAPPAPTNPPVPPQLS
jgi:hypothetical protein